MRLGLYTFAILAVIAIIGAFTYTINPNNFIIEIMGINFNFPVAVWIVLPMLLLFLFTIGHMLFYGLKNYFKLKKWQRDADTLEDALYWSLVNEPKEQKYVMNEIKGSAMLLSKASLDVSDNVEGLSPRLAKVVNIIQKIKNGEYIDLKEIKMAKVFNAGNPILIQNRLNCLESDEKFVEDVMKATSSYSEIVQKQALEIFARKSNFETARKYRKVFDVENFLMMLNRVNTEDEMGLTKEILNDFVDALKLSCVDFIKVAQVTKKYFEPDENIGLFTTYQNSNDKAQSAYLYLLFEYELLDQVAAYLEEQEEDEFMKFRALYQLKRSNSKCKLEDIIDVHSVCAEKK
ncbi:MAG: hypothetical protein COA92_09005 [Sulfurovum sp.]|nr:MAG: hypothetical protein COA92_09005 [Sulfurovum sp.]